MCTLVTRSQCSVQERIHVVVLIQIHGLGLIRREGKRLYPLFIQRLNPSFLILRPSPDKHVLAQSVMKSVGNVSIKSHLVSLRFITLRTSFTRSFVFAIIAVVRNCKMHAVPENDEASDGLICGVLGGNETTLISSPNQTVGLSGVLSVY